MKPLADLATDWSSLSPLLDEALALTHAERELWLQALPTRPGLNEQQRESLRVLLTAAPVVETGDFMSTLPRLAEPASAVDTPQPDMAIGPYRLISELGRGGMGSVWLAERSDGQHKRRVALKLPHRAWGSALTQRLERERHILAALEHPHIARLYDAGTDAQGRPYLAMERVEGQPIDVYSSEHDLPVRERLLLLLQVCDAVAHAHSRLVVHRDLKPNNILVTAEAQVRLLDFGVAKLLEGERTEETALTREVGHAMTPDYASPEQLKGMPLGTASDVYSLGVVAFELLAGQRPYRLGGTSAAELEQAISAGDPARASAVAPSPALKRALRGDLDAILGKALRRDAAERYGSVEQLAQDIRRHLAAEPVLAQEPTLGYRMAKFVRRHRFRVGAAALAGVGLIGGAGLALWQAGEAREQAAVAQRESATARAVQGFIESVFRANSGDQADPAQGRSASARDLLDRGAERIDRELRSAPEARLQLLELLGNMYEDLFEFARSAEMHRRELALARELKGASSRESLRALANLAWQLVAMEKLDDARLLLDEAQGIAERQTPRDADSELRLQTVLAWLALRTDAAQSLVHAERAIAAGRQLPLGPWQQRALNSGTNAALYSGQPARARELAQEAIGLIETRPEVGVSELATLYGLLGAAQARLGDPQAAIGSYGHALELANQRAEAPRVRYALLRLSNFYFDLGMLHEALAHNQAGRDWALAHVAAPTTFEPSFTLAAYGRTQVHLGRLEEGLATLDLAVLTVRNGKFGPSELMPPMLFRSRAFAELGRLEEAAQVLQSVAAMAGQTSNGPGLLAIEQRYLQVASGQGAKALEGWQTERRARKLPELPASDDAPVVLAESAWLHQAAGQSATARAQAEQALANIAKSKNARFMGRAEARATLVLGRALLDSSNPREALAMLEKALPLNEAQYDAQRSLEVARAWQALAQARELNGDAAGARAARERARRIQATHPTLRTR